MNETDRGEAANHGMYDAALLLRELVLWREGKKDLQQALEDYQVQVVERAHGAVLQSREACIDCHDFNTLGPSNPILSVSRYDTRTHL